LPQEIGVRLDRRRTFSDEQKAEMLKRDGAKCQMFQKDLGLSPFEGDHYPLAWRDGGPTEIENGRLVHTSCHVRGRPAASADVIGPIEI